MGFFSTDHIPRSVLPPRAITPNTVRSAGTAVCPKCGAAYVEGKNFCVECGATREDRRKLDMGSRRVKAVELAQYLTGYLAENPFVYGVDINCNLHYLANDFNRVGQITATDVALSYCVSEKEQKYQYGVEYVYSYKATMNFKKVMNASCEEIVQRWMAANPDLIKVTWTGGRVTCNDNGTYQLYALIVYKKDISAQPSLASTTAPAPTPAAAPAPAATPAPTAAPARKFCTHCGAKLVVENAAFCGNCGAKL